MKSVRESVFKNAVKSSLQLNIIKKRLFPLLVSHIRRGMGRAARGLSLNLKTIQYLKGDGARSARPLFKFEKQYSILK